MLPQHLGSVVGPEGVEPSPHEVKAQHAPLHLDPILLSRTPALSFRQSEHVNSDPELVGRLGVEPS
jgi:hypothetical protein